MKYVVEWPKSIAIRKELNEAVRRNMKMLHIRITHTISYKLENLELFNNSDDW